MNLSNIFYEHIFYQWCCFLFTTSLIKLSLVCIRNQIWRKRRTLGQILYVVWLIYCSIWISIIIIWQKNRSTCSDVHDKDSDFGVQQPFKVDAWMIGWFCQFQGMSHNQLLNSVLQSLIALFFTFFFRQEWTTEMQGVRKVLIGYNRMGRREVGQTSLKRKKNTSVCFKRKCFFSSYYCLVCCVFLPLFVVVVVVVSFNNIDL